MCTFYDLDATDVAREFAEFRPVFRKLNLVISVEDLMAETRAMRKTPNDDENDDEEDRDGTPTLKVLGRSQLH